MKRMLASRKLIELYDLAVKGEDLGCEVKATHLDSSSGSLFIAFEDPYRICEKVHKSIDITDETVAFARLDVNKINSPVALEIILKKQEG